MLKTEQRNPKSTHIDKMSTLDMVKLMSEENYVAVKAVEDAAESIAAAVDAIALSMENGGRLYYIGAGTSGRLGVLDASECPPTFGVSPDLVSGIIAGGYDCLVKASEGGEDSYENGVLDLEVTLENYASESAECTVEAVLVADGKQKKIASQKVVAK